MNIHLSFTLCHLTPSRLVFGIRRAPTILWHTSLEPVLESPRDFLHISHAAGSGGLSSLGFHTPVVYQK